MVVACSSSTVQSPFVYIVYLKRLNAEENTSSIEVK